MSGVPVLFARLADYISTNFNYHVQIVDYKDGVMAEILKSNKSIGIIEFKDGQPTKMIRNTTMIMQSILPNTIRPELKIDKNTKILFWTLFHYNLIPDFLPINGLRTIHHESAFLKKIDSVIRYKFYKNLQTFVRELHKKSSIHFMDYSTYEITNESLKLNIPNPNILPICIDYFDENKKIPPRQNKSDFNVCWVGRIEDFKTSILQYSINQVKRYADKSHMKIQFTIIGYGKDLAKVQSEVYNSNYFTSTFLGKMDIDLLNEYLTNNVDLLMSMGTSALEGGKLGIPTILLDASYDDIPKDYKFKWLYDSDGSNVAQFIGSKSFKNTGHTIDSIIESVNIKSERIGISCLEYVKKNHSTEAIANLLTENVNKATFTWNDLNPDLIKKNTIRKIYDNYRYK